MLAIHGPLQLREIKAVGWLTGITSTELCNAVAALVAAHLIEATERSRIAVMGDGTRCRVDDLLYRLARQGGGEP